MKLRVVQLGGAVVFAGLMTGACVSTGVSTYEDFQGSIEGGAPCSELFDQRKNFDKEADLERIDADLERLGCDSPDSERRSDD